MTSDQTKVLRISQQSERLTIPKEHLNNGQIAGVIAQINEGFRDRASNSPKIQNIGSEIRVNFNGSDEPKKKNQDGAITRLGYPVLHEYQTEYPAVVVDAIIELYQEYRKAFISLISKNREWVTDYQYCIDKDGIPIIYGVQIDMQALPQDFLQKCKDNRIQKNQIKEALRRQIFEIEGSMAMTPLLEILFENTQGQNTLFKQGNRKMLDGIRKKFQKPIVMLAVTNKKRDAILESEFGMKSNGEKINPTEIFERSGLDNVWGPEEFLAYLENHGENSLPLFYVRSSDPVDKLKNPNAQVEHPLLGNDEIRRMIKANSITLNINNPEDPDLDRRLNDTKEYMQQIGMAYTVQSLDDIFNPDYRVYLDLITTKDHIKYLYTSIKNKILATKKQHPELSQTLATAKIIKKRLGQQKDIENPNRIEKFENLLGYFDSKKTEIESGIKSDNKESVYDSIILLFDKIIQHFGSHIGILQKNTKNNTLKEHVDQELSNNIEKLNDLLVKIDLPILNFENSDQFSKSPFTDSFNEFIQSRGVTIDKILNNTITFRGKPLKDAYGCYGHLPKENILDPNFIQRLGREMNDRGSYVFQVEMPQCIVKDSTPVFENGTHLSAKFIHFLETRQVAISEIETVLSQSTNINRQDLIQELAKAFPIIKNEFWFDFNDPSNPQCSLSYITIDRNFFFPDISGESVDVIVGGGLRLMISANNQEAKEGRIHGNDQTRWAPILMDTPTF